MVDLRQQLTAKLGGALHCAVEVESYATKIDGQALGLYIDGCSRFNDINLSAPDQSTLSVFRQLTAKAPDFAPGWAYLALMEVMSFPGTPPPDRPALLKAVTRDMETARRLDPNFSVTFAADAHFYENNGNKPGRALAILDRGLALHPDSALLHDMRSYFLHQVGRMNESVTAAADPSRHLSVSAGLLGQDQRSVRGTEESRSDVAGIHRSGSGAISAGASLWGSEIRAEPAGGAWRRRSSPGADGHGLAKLH
jgi:hypothetical protein